MICRIVRIDDIYVYSRKRWGDAQAKAYVEGLYAEFAAIAARRRQWRRIPGAFQIDGYFHGYERHLIYWRSLADNDIGIVAILHEKMQQLDRFRDIIRPSD